MRHFTGWTIGLLTIAALGSGCQSKLYDENLALHRQNNELQSKLRESEQKPTQATSPDQSAQLASMQQEIANRDARIADLQQQLNRPTATSTPDESNLLKGIEVTRDDRAGTLTVNLPGDVLFAPGSAEVKSSATATLDKVITAVKKDYPGKKVIVRGYTDTDPITRTKDKWKDNLDLSAARSRSVAQYLAGHGIEHHQIGLQAYGETVPRNSKDRSRRVEIVVATR